VIRRRPFSCPPLPATLHPTPQLPRLEELRVFALLEVSTSHLKIKIREADSVQRATHEGHQMAAEQLAVLRPLSCVVTRSRTYGMQIATGVNHTSVSSRFSETSEVTSADFSFRVPLSRSGGDNFLQFQNLTKLQRCGRGDETAALRPIG
jgi:hypothetical protein